MTWQHIDVPPAGDERTQLAGFLERQRDLFTWKTRGLDAEALSRTVAVSSVTLGGLLKHLAFVEAYWFLVWWKDEAPGQPWDDVDWDADRDWDWHSAAEDSPDELYALWDAAVARSRALVAVAPDLDQLCAKVPEDPTFRPTLRWVLHHMTEEYARHVGHADLIREAIDGQVGEDPPGPPASPVEEA